MVIPLRTPSTKVLAVSAALSLATWLSFRVVISAYVEGLINDRRPASLREAVRLSPDTCKAYEYLALNASFGMEGVSPDQGLDWISKAIKCQPLEARYWVILATDLGLQGKEGEAVAAARKALSLDPRDALLEWEVGNILLRAGLQKEAFQDFSHVLTGDPNLSPSVFSVCWRASGDGDVILQDAIPNASEVNLAYLDFLTSGENLRLPAAQKVWARLVGLREPFPAERSWHYLDALIAAGKNAEAILAWNEMVGLGILPHAEAWSPDDLVVNGGFEAPLVNEGLDWRISSASGVDVGIDNLVSHEGQNSLVISFEGLSNVRFGEVGELVLAEPDTPYLFSAYMKSRALTTDCGPYIEITDPKDPGKYTWKTSNMLGTNEWTHCIVELKTGPDTHSLSIRVRRDPTVQRDNLIEGTLWIDDVHLFRNTHPSGTKVMPGLQ